AAFNSQQLAVLSQLSQQMMSDSNKFQAAAKEFKEDVESLTTENLNTTSA
ncbi:phasin family protein, partial [Vibrio fortis]